MIKLVRYKDEDHKYDWQEFIKSSKNATFLFSREYLSHQKDNFDEQSVLVFKNEKLIALIPMTRHEDLMSLHGGLTYGGILVDLKMTSNTMISIFEALESYLRSLNINKVIYKTIPYIYHDIPAQEDEYALFRNQWNLFRRDIATVIDLRKELFYSKGRKSQIKKGQKKFKVKQSMDVTEFMELEEQLLKEKYNTKAVHSKIQMQHLIESLPQNIKLFIAYNENEKDIHAGVIIYETKYVAHAQYIATSKHGREHGALDVVTDYLLKEEYADHPSVVYFDFGKSTEKEGQILNANLIRNKESYGGSSVCYDQYMKILSIE